MAGIPHNKKTDAQHRKDGTWRADRHGAQNKRLQGKAVKKTVTPPKHFKLTAQEKAIFKATVKLLHEHNLVTALDLDVVCVYAQSVYQWQFFWEDLRENGHIILSGENDEIAKVNPAGGLMQAAFQRMVKFQTEFGMGQLSRQKLEHTGWDETEVKDDSGKNVRLMHPAAVQTRKSRRG